MSLSGDFILLDFERIAADEALARSEEFLQRMKLCHLYAPRYRLWWQGHRERR